MARLGHGPMPNLSPLSGEERKLDFGTVRSVEDFRVKCLLQLYVLRCSRFGIVNPCSTRTMKQLFGSAVRLRGGAPILDTASKPWLCSVTTISDHDYRLSPRRRSLNLELPILYRNFSDLTGPADYVWS